MWLCRFITAAFAIVIGVLAAAAYSVATGFGARPDATDEKLTAAGWIGMTVACAGAAAVTMALHPHPKKRWPEAAAWAVAAVPLFFAAYIAVAAVAALAGHVHHRGFD